MNRNFGFLTSFLTRLPFDFKPKNCAGISHGCKQIQRLGDHREGIRVQGEWYCSASCFERGTLALLSKLERSHFRRSITHRLPLGLVLLSSGSITHQQLSQALTAQRSAGKGRVGEWLQRSGAANEHDVTRALSQQWACPVLRSFPFNQQAASLLPLHLMEWHRMVLFQYAAATKTAYVAFSEQVDYPVLGAIENVLECRAEPCLIVPSEMERKMDELRKVSSKREVVFERLHNRQEIAAILRSYALEVQANAARISRCGDYIWARLFAHQIMDILLRIPALTARSE